MVDVAPSRALGVNARKMQPTSLSLALATVLATGVLRTYAQSTQPAVPLPSPATSASATATPVPMVQLTANQLSSIKIAPVTTFSFHEQRQGIGTIDFESKLYFNATDAYPVFPPVEGKIVKTLAELGDQVRKGQALYTIVTAKDPALEVASPINGQITSVTAVEGVLVQPGKPPAPYSVADVSRKWLVANVPESDSQLYTADEDMEITVSALPGRSFHGKISKIYPGVDINTHRLTVRAELFDPKNELRSGMLANFVLQLPEAAISVAVPPEALVREGDGTVTAWVTRDREHFFQRIVQVGLREKDQVQILSGLEAGELIVTTGAIFLDNMLQAPPSD